MQDTDESAGGELPDSALDLDGLVARADLPGLLALARAYRTGATPSGRDMRRAYDAYRAAAELGSADAEYAVALFCMTGGVVPQDPKEGTTRLRAAAERGSVPAKVYLGNLYELGIHYRADPEKADVWYRNAARGARIESEPGSEEYARSLAELGCARYVLALVDSGGVDGDEKARLLQRARAHGYGLRLKDDSAIDRPTLLEALHAAEGGAPRPETTVRSASRDEAPARLIGPQGAEISAASPARAAAGVKRARSTWTGEPSRAAAGLAAFAYALLFAAAGLGAGYAASQGARELVAHGQVLPVLGSRTHLVFPIVFAAVGVLPTWLVYRLWIISKAGLMGGAMGGVGWVVWGTGQGMLHPQRPVQALAFGVAGFLGGLLVLGLLGGTKRQPSRPPRPPA